MAGETFRAEVAFRLSPLDKPLMTHVEICGKLEGAKHSLMVAVNELKQTPGPESREIVGRVLMSMPGMTPTEIARRVVRGTVEVTTWNL